MNTKNPDSDLWTASHLHPGIGIYAQTVTPQEPGEPTKTVAIHIEDVAHIRRVALDLLAAEQVESGRAKRASITVRRESMQLTVTARLNKGEA